MNILISNDDGINAPGINVLVNRLKQDGHTINVIAPDSNRSAVSNHLTMYKEHKLTKIDDTVFAHTGYPADCIFTGVKSDLLENVDVIISGINKGGNMGTDIIYSGTCAVARQGVIFGIPSIALSVEPVNRGQPESDYKYDALADFAAKNLTQLIKMAKTDFPQAFVNVNALSIDEYKGVKITDKTNFRYYGDRVKIIHEKDNQYKTQFIFGGGENEIVEENTDLYYCNQGFISIARVNACPNCAEIVDDIEFKL